MRVVALVMVINFIRHILIIFILFFNANLLAKPLSYSSQISQNFSSGMVCSSLYKKLGFVQDVSVLWIDTKEERNQYALINTINKKERNKIFYLCKKFSNDNSSSTSNFIALKDLKVENIFRDSLNEAFKSVFKVANEETSRYILSKLFLPDYGVQKQELVLAFTSAQKDLSTSKYITKKPSKKTKKLTKKEPKISKKIKSYDDLPFGNAYFYAVDNKKNSLIGYVVADPKSKAISIGKRKFKKGNRGKMFNLNDGSVCDVYSTVETARLNRIYDGKVTVECSKNTYSGSWIQKGVEGRGLAIDEDGNEIDFGFAMNKNIAEAGLNQKMKTYVVKKPIVREQKRIVQSGKKFDKIPPTLNIKDKFIFDSPNYKITGAVSDKGSKKLYVFVNDTLVDVKNGKFQIEKFSPIDETLQVKAVDEWGNSVEKKIDIEINIKSVAIAKEVEPLSPNKIRNINSSNTVAIIIGIEKYAETAPATYANRDAKFFAEYAQKAFGVKRNNMKLLINEQATLTQTFKALEKWLPAKIEKNKTNVLVYFAGHGLASEDGKELYLLVHDTDTDLLRRTALARKDLFDLISKKNPASVKMFFDTCYSGTTREEKMLLASARGITIKADIEDDIPNNFTIFSASQDNQISSGFKEAKHGIFSYYLMKGMEGKADTNKNNKICNAELLDYITKNVGNKALEMGRTQTPSFVGSKEENLLSY